MTSKDMTEDTYIRKLPFSVLNQIANILDPYDYWKHMIPLIPKPLDKPGPLYNNDHLLMFERQNFVRGGSPTKELLRDWGTRNPRVKDIIRVLTEAQLYRAADYLSVTVLGGSPVSKFEGFQGWDTGASASNMFPPKKENLTDESLMFQLSIDSLGPGEENSATPGDGHVNQNVTVEDEVTTTNVLSPETVEFVKSLEDTNLQQFNYDDLKSMTDNFNEVSVHKNGKLLGHGGFASVFLGKTKDNQLVAIKKLKETIDFVMRQFKTELQVLTTYQHEHLLPVVGLSCDGSNFCIVYKYMVNGSLEDRLACQGGTKPLTASVRIRIAKETAKGICHLHTFGKKPLVHRDIKSANILLDENFVAKLGDFGFARLGPQDKTSVQTTTVIGTTAYMAPEAFKNDISDKLDTYSYGGVLLELLTGLLPYDETREESKDLIGYVEDRCAEESLIEMLDKTAGDWDDIQAQKLYNIAEKCLETKKRDRPKMTELLDEILNL